MSAPSPLAPTFDLRPPTSLLSLIVAVAENGVIGRGGTLPWHLSADLKRFKRLTMGHAIIMGRRTYESIGRPLPGRRSIVVSRNADYHPGGVEVAPNLNEALRLAAGDDEVFVIGGSRLFAEALPRADRLHLTRIHAAVEGETFFSEPDWSQWRVVAEEPRERDPATGLDYSFLCYERGR